MGSCIPKSAPGKASVLAFDHGEVPLRPSLNLTVTNAFTTVDHEPNFNDTLHLHLRQRSKVRNLKN